MPTIRLSGAITARSPILITRPEQGDAPLMMNVIRNQVLTQVHVIPGETIKGLLRSTAYTLCVDAGRLSGDLKVSLDQLYRQTLGGLSFASESRELGSDASIREEEPLLSLFGAAKPRITGRIIVHHALAQATIGAQQCDGIGLPPGTRRDSVTARPEFADLLSGEDRALWSRQNNIVSSLAEANRKVEDAKRILGRARRTEGVDIKQFETELEAAQAEVAAIKNAPEFQHSVQRPIPTKNAAPAGTVYDHGIEVVDGSPAEIGLLFATLELWNLTPRIGGGKTTGYGQIEAHYAIECLSEAPLSRDRTWVAAGRVMIGTTGSVIRTTSQTVQVAVSTWREVESGIRVKTKVFG
jgi:CRISPR/Cas system CSM-associated protein Csm3 (group 7 of RAMP superfamily)